MKTHEIESNGQKFVFSVLKDTTEPCPVCGVPACGQEDILWYEENNRRIAIIFDGGYLDLAIGGFLDKNLKKIEYGSHPAFIREWNECRGWADSWDYNGYVLEIDDYLRAIELLMSNRKEKWVTPEDLNDMRKLARHAKKIGAQLKIVRG